MPWTNERVEMLKQLWADGLSTKQIANELRGITRNAVIGKVHRLGLTGRTKKKPARSRPRKKRSSRHTLQVSRPATRVDPGIAYGYEAEYEPELIETPFEQRKTLLQLTEKTCRWPVGNPGSSEFFFCGGETPKNIPYCALHSRVAFRALDKQRRRQQPLHK